MHMRKDIKMYSSLFSSIGTPQSKRNALYLVTFLTETLEQYISARMNKPKSSINLQIYFD